LDPSPNASVATHSADRLTISLVDLEAAAAASGRVSADAVPPLWQALVARSANIGTPLAPRHESPRFNFTHLLYYFGGLLAIGAATLFMTEAFERLGSWALLAISVGYAAACCAAARWLDAKRLEIPAGILATLAVCLVPLAAWALQHALGMWPEGGPDRYQQYHTHIDWRWLTLEFVTLAAAAVALWWLRYPFLMMPVAFTLWYMSMDLARLIVAPNSGPWQAEWEFYRDFSMFFGLSMVLLGFWIDARSRAPGASQRDYAFWLYLLGMLTFWCALSARRSDRELDKFLYAVLNLGFVFLGAMLQRRVFTICGGLGFAGYLGYLSYKVFKNSLMFPVALTVIGLGVMALGIWWQRNETRIEVALRRHLPRALHRWLPVLPGG
jgi:hypothetical protein